MGFLAGRKFLIVGGNGFVGNRIAATLVSQGAQVTALTRYFIPYSGLAPSFNILRTPESTGSLAM